MKDTKHSIFQSSRKFFSGTALSRIGGMFRDISMAYVFGTEPAIANFMVAFRLSHLFRRLFGEGALQSAFTPHFEKLRHENPERSASFFRDLLYSLTFFLVGLIVLCSLGIGLTLYLGEWSPATRDVLWLTFLMLPSLLFICLFGVNSALLQCQKIYFIPGVAPLAFNFAWIAAVFILQGNSSEYRMSLLSLGVIIACLLQWVVTLPQTLAYIRKHFPKKPSIHFFSSDIITLSKPLFLGILGVAATQINNAVDSIFALYSGAEGPAYLWYAMRLQQLPLALFGVSLAGALLPPLSRALQANNQELYREFLKHALDRSFAFIFPLTLISILIGIPLVNLLYGHGDFTPEAVLETTYCVWAYLFGLVPSIFILILAPAYFAKKNYTLPALTSFLNMLINTILNFWFIFGLGWGPVSVAFATSISSWVNMIVLLLPILHGKVLILSGKESIHFLKVMFTSLVAFSVSALIFYLLRDQISIFDSLFPLGKTLLPRNFFAQFFNLLIPSLLFVLLYSLGGVLFSLNGFRKRLNHTESI